MTESGKPDSSSLEKIKQELDPAYSYMIFEKETGSSEETEFRQVIDILMRLNLSVHERGLFLDDSRGRLLLVVKFDPARADKIMQEFINVGLPEDIAFYAYGSRVAD
jgi:hypothetical protein